MLRVTFGLDLALGCVPVIFGAAIGTAVLLPKGVGTLADFVESDVVCGDHGDLGWRC